MTHLIAAMWTHGHGFTPQRPADGYLEDVEGQPWTAVVGRDDGWGRTFELVPRAVDRDGDHVDTWFHAGIPSPVWMQDRPLYLDRVFLLFSLHVGHGLCGLAGLHLWDGPNGPMRVFDNPPGYVSHAENGDWRTIRENRREPTSSNVWYPRDVDGARPHLAFGLGISVFVRAFSTAERARITFHGTGADFVDSPSDV